MFSGAYFPESDFQGRFLQDLLSPSSLDSISINAIAAPSGGFIVFQWFEEAAASQKLMSSLIELPACQYANAVTIFAFEFSENLFISPAWWNGLDTNTQTSLEARVMNIIHSSECLIPDNIQYHSWKRPIIHTNWA